MESRLFRGKDMTFAPHPRLANVRMATYITGKDTETVGVSMVDIAPNEGAPIHRHDSQVDSIFVISGKGEAFVNGRWEFIEAGDYIFVPKGNEHGIRNTGHGSLRLFVHHSPPLM
ncbi:MAG: cupin domain-containing protein [Deltaproteobacteria bacterium]|nr:cupin domain-containing protein [Deltaproteobacteria bacterium]